MSGWKYEYGFQKDVKSIRLRPEQWRPIMEWEFQKDVKSIRLRPVAETIRKAQ